MVAFLTHLLETSFTHYGYWIVFLAMLVENASGIGSLVPGDTLLVLAGFFTRGTSVNLPLLMVIGIIGAVIGDNISYFVGRKWGRKLVAWLEPRWKSLHRHLKEAQTYFKKHGGKTVLFGRNVAIIRTYVPLLAGIGKMPYRKFFLYNIVGASLQISAFLLIGYFFGQYRHQIERVLRDGGLGLLGVILVVAVVVYRRRRGKQIH